MAILKCKMCGGSMEILPDSSVGECQYCGTKQTLPRLRDDRRANLFNRANHYRMSNEFDKATGLYEQILTEDDSDAEVYWSLVLCRYGIKYEKDPKTGVQLPTINRVQYASILTDPDYRSALSHADKEQRELYTSEARRINEIQKRILDISSREAPFDVFISYKEKDDKTGQRTLDSVLATDIYEQLTRENLKVFLSRITLEDKLGTEYEPYIFAALNSAKVMIVVGTKPEHFNAVWVKNEWSRYLALINKGENKTLIPAFRDMDPYDLPEEFSALVAQDMAKIGFMQDLKRGILKIVGEDRYTESSGRTVVANGPTLNSQLKRGYMSLEDRDWTSADTFFDKALDMDPECAEAYLGKALAKNQSRSLQDFAAARLRQQPAGMDRVPCEVNANYLRETAQNYGIPHYYPGEGIVQRLEACQQTYDAAAPGWERLLEAERSFWESDRNMSRALRFSKGKLASSLAEIRQRSERYLTRSLEQSRNEDQSRRSRCAQSYAALLDQAENAIKAEALEASKRQEADYQSFLEQMQNAKTPEQYEALQKKDYPGLRGYRDFDQQMARCGENADYLRRQNAARAAEAERLRQEKDAREAHQRESNGRRMKRCEAFYTLSLLGFIAAFCYFFFLYVANDYELYEVSLGVVAAALLLCLTLRSYCAGVTGKKAPILTWLVFFTGIFSSIVGTWISANEGYLGYYGGMTSSFLTFGQFMRFGPAYAGRMLSILGSDDFVLKYIGVSAMVSLLLIWIFGAIGKGVRKKIY